MKNKIALEEHFMVPDMKGCLPDNGVQDEPDHLFRRVPAPRMEFSFFVMPDVIRHPVARMRAENPTHLLPASRPPLDPGPSPG
ncbi:MAG: hypothetical protein ACYC1L_10100 [Alphaproteobacteria bacterium]